MSETLIHKSAKIHPTVELGAWVIIEEGCIIGKDSIVGHRVHLYPQTKIGNNVEIVALPVSFATGIAH